MWIHTQLPLLRAGINVGEVVAHTVFVLLGIALYHYILTNLRTLGLAVFEAAALFGVQAGGGAFTVAQFFQPTAIFEVGARAASPILDFLNRMTGFTAIKNIHTILNYSLAYIAIMVAFLLMAFNVALTLIEFHFALMLTTVLLPWAPLAATSFLAEFSLSWLIGMAVRVLIQAAMMGIAFPLFDILTMTLTAGGDPEFWGAVSVAGASLFFTLLAWIIPNRATAIAGRGMALGIGADSIVAGFQAASSNIRGFGRGVGTVVTGTSSWLKARQG